MNRETAIEKVKKLLRLSKSSNEHEAAAAMRQAQALMRQHQIEEAEAAGAAAEIDPIEEVASDARRGKTTPVDLAALASLIAEAFGTRTFARASKPLLSGSWQTEAWFVGPSPRAELSAYAFNVLYRQLCAAKRVHLRRVKNPKNRAARGDHFGIGFVQGVRALLTAWDLSIEDRARISAHMGAKHPKLESRDVEARRGARSVPAYGDQHAGRNAGRSAQLHRGVAGARQRQIGGPTS